MSTQDVTGADLFAPLHGWAALENRPKRFLKKDVDDTQAVEYSPNMKTQYELVKRHTDYSPTPENGHGDYCTTTWERVAVCEATSERQAQNIFKRMFPAKRISFAAQFAGYHAWEMKNEPQAV